MEKSLSSVSRRLSGSNSVIRSRQLSASDMGTLAYFRISRLMASDSRDKSKGTGSHSVQHFDWISRITAVATNQKAGLRQNRLAGQQWETNVFQSVS
uniref:Uncharacterized protein n=1 Tax=Candidatus Kentrum sp. LPFa TaxID=2126335 RepID=A0A450WSI4_9GAMM|nr:MAG: hypothetical protein BECKLPF1236B_GA0070989_119412 [Candidatus Kentron sp. LPFa]